MTGLDQRGGAGAGFYHPRVPQPFVETLALQTPTTSADRPLARDNISITSFLRKQEPITTDVGRRKDWRSSLV
jgi:hypothetical protein